MKFLILFPFLLLGFSLQAQEAPGLSDIIVDSSSHIPVYKYRALGASFRSTRDKALSNLLFQGYGASFQASSWKYNKQWLWQSSFNAQAHMLKSEKGSSTLNEIGLSYQFALLRDFQQLKYRSWRFWGGPEMRMLVNTRLHSRNMNNVASYDGAIALGGAAMISKQFILWGCRFAVSNQFQLPLFFVYTRPAYAWGVPPAVFEEQEGAWKEAIEAGTLNNIMLMANQVNLDFLLRKRKKGKVIKYSAYRLSYNWSYFQINTKNNLKTGGHELALTRVITF